MDEPVLASPLSYARDSEPIPRSVLQAVATFVIVDVLMNIFDVVYYVEIVGNQTMRQRPGIFAFFGIELALSVCGGLAAAMILLRKHGARPYLRYWAWGMICFLFGAEIYGFVSWGNSPRDFGGMMGYFHYKLAEVVEYTFLPILTLILIKPVSK